MLFCWYIGRTFTSGDELTQLIHFKPSLTGAGARTGITGLIQGLQLQIENQEVVKEFMVKRDSFLRCTCLAELRKQLLAAFYILYGRLICISFLTLLSQRIIPTRMGIPLCCLGEHYSIWISLSTIRLKLFPVQRYCPHGMKNNTQKQNTNHLFLDWLLSVTPSALLDICLRTILETALRQEIHAARDSLGLKHLVDEKKMFHTMLQWCMELIATRCY